jgi:NAD(P)-dependent dehydrogenase (short-subunit alcohol dehydrogenase family)
MKADSKVVLITGTSSGFGLAIATLLQERGYIVFGTSRNPSKTNPGKFEMLPLDVNSDESVNNCVKIVLEKTNGKIDVLVNNAGFVLTGGIEETKLEDAKMQLETNFWGYVRMIKAVPRALSGLLCDLEIRAGGIF